MAPPRLLQGTHSRSLQAWRIAAGPGTPGPQPAPAVLWHLGLPAGPFAHWAPKARMVPRRTARSSVIFSTSQASGSLIRASPVSEVPEGQHTPGIRVCSPALPPLGITVGGWNGACAKPGPPWPPAVCSVLLGCVGTGAPERAAPWMGPHQKPAAVWNPALPPRRNSVLPLALRASLGEGSRCWVHPPAT